MSNLAALVDTRTWTTGGGNTFPGAIAPWGEVQWSPDTMPNRSAGGGYSYGDTTTTGYSLTHVSGPGCGAGGDIPMLPITGALPSGNPNDVTTAFSNDNEIAQAGYYSAQSNQPNTITSQFTATPHSSMAQFTYPSGQQAGFLIKLHDSQNGEYAPSTATVVSNTEISGSDTSGHFCGEDTNDGQKQEYTAHFDITFDQPFTAKIINGSDGTPDAVYLTFDTTQSQTVQAKVGLSYVSDANAKLDWQQENPGWNFDTVKSAAQQQWNNLLGRIQISGGAYDRTQMFYSLLYKDFVEPNIVSDVNGQFMGADMTLHTVPAGQGDQYGMYSGWDTFHSLAAAAGDARPAGRERPGAVAAQLLQRGQAPPAVGLQQPEQLRDGRRPDAVDHRRLLRLRRAQLRHEDRARRHARPGDHDQRRASRAEPRGQVRLPARGRQLSQLLQPARVRVVAARVRQRRPRPVAIRRGTR